MKEIEIKGEKGEKDGEMEKKKRTVIEGKEPL